MDLFSYTTKSAYISNLKLIKDIEEELRILSDKVYTIRHYTTEKSIDEVIKPFQLFTQCFKLFESKSSRKLPDFLYTARTNSATVVVDYLVTHTQITYDQYIDIFKDLNTELVLPSSTVDSKLGLKSGMQVLIYLARVIQDNPNPHKLKYYNYASQLYDILMHNNLNYKLLLQALAIRQNMLNDKPYTILEDYIQFYTDRLQTNPNPTATLEAQQLLNASIELDQIVATHVI